MNKSELKNTLPANVWGQVESWMKSHRKRASSVNVRDMTGNTLYFAEDMRYHAFRGNADLGVVQCGGEWTGYRPNDAINKRTVPPVGTWVVETGFFCGMPVCSVMNWGEAEKRIA